MTYVQDGEKTKILLSAQVRSSGYRRNLKSFAISKIATRVLSALYNEFPPVVRVESTNYCNSRCIMCPHPKQTRKLATMSVDLFRKIARECSHHRIRKMHLHNFGEPLLDNSLGEKLAIARDMGINQIKFFTNGSLLYGRKLEAILNAPPSEIKISVDGATKETYEKIRVGLKFEQTRNNILNLMEEKKRRKLKTRVVITWVTLPENRHEVEAFRKFWEAKVDKIDIGREHNWAMEPVSQGLPAIHACLRPWESLTILATGEVALCCLDWDGKVILGDVNKQSISEIWKGSLLKEIRKAHIATDFSNLPLCQRCSKIL